MDIVQRLRSNFLPSTKCAVTGHAFRPIKDTETLDRERREAATEITRLREENKLLREALGVISQRMEALEDESFEGLSAETTEHAAGFWRGQKFAAKSLRLHLHDMTRTAPATTGGE